MSVHVGDPNHFLKVVAFSPARSALPRWLGILLHWVKSDAADVPADGRSKVGDLPG